MIICSDNDSEGAVPALTSQDKNRPYHTISSMKLNEQIAHDAHIRARPAGLASDLLDVFNNLIYILHGRPNVLLRQSLPAVPGESRE